MIATLGAQQAGRYSVATGVDPGLGYVAALPGCIYRAYAVLAHLGRPDDKTREASHHDATLNATVFTLGKPVTRSAAYAAGNHR